MTLRKHHRKHSSHCLWHHERGCLLKCVVPVMIWLLEPEFFSSLFESLTDDSVYCPQIIKAGRTCSVMEEEANKETLSILWMHIVDPSQVWLALSCFPRTIHPPIVLWYVNVEKSPCKGVGLVQFEKGGQLCLTGLSYQVGQIGLSIEVDPLSVRKMDIQPSNGGRMLMYGESE